MNITREYIEQLSNIEPHCFETDREEQWFNIGLQYGLEAADANPKSPWISVKDKLPCNEKDLIVEFFNGVELRTKKVGVLSEDGYIDITYMYSLPPHGWHWNTNDTITHWFPIPERQKNRRLNYDKRKSKRIATNHTSICSRQTNSRYNRRLCRLD